MLSGEETPVLVQRAVLTKTDKMDPVMFVPSPLSHHLENED